MYRSLVAASFLSTRGLQSTHHGHPPALSSHCLLQSRSPSLPPLPRLWVGLRERSAPMAPHSKRALMWVARRAASAAAWRVSTTSRCRSSSLVSGKGFPVVFESGLAQMISLLLWFRSAGNLVLSLLRSALVFESGLVRIFCYGLGFCCRCFSLVWMVLSKGCHFLLPVHLCGGKAIS